MRAFLELYLDEGRGPLPKGKLFAVLAGAAFGGAPRQKSGAVDAITSSLVSVSYLLNSYEEAQNYVAMAEGWAVLAASIARYVAKHEIAEKHWQNSLNLVKAEISANLALLRRDATGREDFLEGDIRVDGGPILGARTTIVLGLLSFHEVCPFAKDKSRDEVLALIRRHLARRLIWGDSAFPYFFYIVRFLEANGEGALAQNLLIQLFRAVIDSNLARSGPIFPGPYVPIEEILENQIPDRLQDFDLEGYRGSSFILRSLLEMLVRRGRRDVVEQHWRQFSYCQQHEFIPDRPEDVFTWRTKEGTNVSRFPSQTQSWAALVAESSDYSNTHPLNREFRDVLGLQILLCPQRATPSVVRELDTAPNPLLHPNIETVEKQE